MMLSRIPSARRVDGPFLLMVVAMPLVAALAASLGVLLIGPTDAGGPVAVLLDVAKFCYLAVGMAHLSRGLVDRTDGGLASQAWWNPWYEAEGLRSQDTADYWHCFPNHFDGAAIGVAMALILAML